MGSTRNGRPKVPETGERGTSHSDAFSLFAPVGNLPGDRRRRPTPQEINVVRDTDGWAEGAFVALTRPIRATTWSVVPHEDDAGEADLCREMLTPLLSNLVAGMCGAVGDGISFAELVWELRDDEPWLADVAFRPVDQCEPIRSKTGRIEGFKQVAYSGRGMVNETFRIDEMKAFVFLHDEASNRGVGRSALTNAFHNATDKRKLDWLRKKGLEKSGLPTTHGKTNATGAQREAFERAVNDARGGASVVTNLEDQIAFLSAPNAGVGFRQAITDGNFEAAVASQVAWLALAQEGNSGSYNSSDVQMRLLTSVTEGRIAEMEEAASALPKMVCDLYFGLGAAVPSIRAESVDEEPKDRIRSTTEEYFARNGVPEWLVGPLVEAYARMMGFEKPEGADGGAKQPRAAD